MKLAIGLVVKDFVSPEPLDKFLDNAEKYGHAVHSLIVAHSRKIDRDVVTGLARKATIHTVKINDNVRAQGEFKRRGISEKSADTLLRCGVLDDFGLVPYGFNRNTVLIEALLTGVETLIFIDSDVSPRVLVSGESGVELEEVDFFGRHLAQLNRGAAFTTSDYSGYNILPPADFDGMSDLLMGLQKEDMLQYWQTSGEHGCLAFQGGGRSPPKPASKVLGGNLGIRLTEPKTLPPFFSPHYYMDGKPYLARGEDTIVSRAIVNDNKICIDIDTYIFHNTYGDFPQKPDLKTSLSVQERFFYACTGWIGRNPFLNYLSGEDLRSVRERQAYHLARGAGALAEYTSNPIFNKLPKALETSWANLPDAIDEYSRTMEAWNEFIAKE